MGAFADGAAGILSGDLEDQAAAVHLGQLGAAGDLQAHGGGAEVLGVHQGAHGALALGQVGGDGRPGGLLQAGDHHGGGQHVQGAAAHGLGGELVGHDELDFGGNSRL